MTNTEVVTQLVTIFGEFITFMLPIIGLMAGLAFVVTWLMYITVGIGRRVFK